MNDYQHEQLEALNQVVAKTGSIDSLLGGMLCDSMQAYLLFRLRLEKFLQQHFSGRCTRACFENRTSACCSKDGVIIFWADMVVNVSHSSDSQVEDLYAAIREPKYADKCIYLGGNGCRWKVRPLGCALFLCDGVQADVLVRDPRLRQQWDTFKSKGRSFRWPDRPVLFDDLERVFMTAGCHSSLMHLNTSPGLLAVKRKAGLLS